ncbi:MAG TPA: F0F1 ATP synthase subunit B' [Stellaceae bacterium]|jgi:F-type H+-transporting ATPase subunit b|nr:F0F1 ATP synthase subunit B' [Stellaceae bacterium]
MPQLDITTFAPQLVWLAITFIVLYVLMTKLGLPQIAAALDARRNRIDGDLARAASLKSEAEATLAAYEKALADARAAAQATLKATSDKLAAEAAARQRDLAATLAAQIEAAERRIADSKTQALAEMRGVAVDIGRAVVEKLTGSAPDSARMASAVDSTLGGAAAGAG